MVDSAGGVGNGDGGSCGGFIREADSGESGVEQEGDEELNITFANGLEGVLSKRPLMV